MRALPIGPLEAFVLSRVDGHTSDQEIGLVTGLSAPEVSAVLTRLALLGAITYGSVAPKGEESGPATTAHTPRGSSTSGQHARVASSAPPLGNAPSAPAPSSPLSAAGGISPPPTPAIRSFEAPAYDRAELEAEAEIEPKRKELILDTFYSLERATHYELFRLPSDADKKAIKGAYYDLVSTFHPDKYFGKSLGHFKLKLEKIFQRITEAHDTLTRAKPREEYDRYLESQRATRALETDDAMLAEMEAIRAELEREARQATGQASIFPPSPPPPAPQGVDPFAATRTLPSRQATPIPVPPESLRARLPLTQDERRRALARKLGGSMPPVPPPASEPKHSIPSPSARAQAAGSLKTHYESRLSQLRSDRIKRYLQQAEEAVTSKNLVAAANALRIAVSLAPEDAAIAERFDDIERQAAATLADQYLEQAKYDERRGYFLEAAQAYERVLRGRPTPHVYERAAHCLVEARTELKKAVDFGRKAVEKAPRELAYRITLARAYARAEMEQSALAELERARTLAPSDDTIKDWIKRVKRGEV